MATTVYKMIELVGTPRARIQNDLVMAHIYP
jgi:flavin-binding protein dodecin